MKHDTVGGQKKCIDLYVVVFNEEPLCLKNVQGASVVDARPIAGGKIKFIHRYPHRISE